MELGDFGVETEIEKLKRDRNLLMIEIIKLKQQQQSSRKEMIEMEQRVQVCTRLKFDKFYGLIGSLHMPTDHLYINAWLIWWLPIALYLFCG